MGRLPTLQLMTLKAAHYHELLGMITGYKRPLTATTLRPARDSCEGCHWPDVVHDDKVRTKVHYDTDAEEHRDAHAAHRAHGRRRGARKATRGIHWHIEQNVEYVSTDEQKRTIPWVRITGKDGKTTTYFDATSKVGRAEMDQAPKRRMDCIDCHNAAGHPFRNPADRVDNAIADGHDRPQHAVDQGARAGDHREGVAAPRPDRGAGPAVREDHRRRRAEGRAEARGEGGRAAVREDRCCEILKLSEFEAKDLTWKSFPNHVGHRDFPGCFRCHDGKHVNEKGEAIRLQCTLCHDIPQVTVDGELKTVASTVAPGLTPPDSHNEPNWMHDHRSKIDSSCAMCHGPIKWGKDGGSFCSNPACHGRKWPEMNLDATKG